MKTKFNKSRAMRVIMLRLTRAEELIKHRQDVPHLGKDALWDVADYARTQIELAWNDGWKRAGGGKGKIL